MNIKSISVNNIETVDQRRQMIRQVIILGAHRSGTSAVAGLIELMGAHFGSKDVRMRPKPDNPKGFWERYDVVEINDAILALAGGSWCRTAELDLSSMPEEAGERVQQEMAEVLRDLEGGHPWMLKDPRMCLTFPLWRHHFDTPVVVLVQRNPLEIASSLHRRNGIPLFVGLALWEVYTRSALRASSDFPRLVVRYEELLQDPAAFSVKLFNRLQRLGVDGLSSPSPSAASHIIDAGLQREAWPDHALEQFLRPEQLYLWESMVADSIVDGPELHELSASARRALSDFAEWEIQLKSAEKREYQVDTRQKVQLDEQRNEYIYQMRVLDDWVRQLLEDSEAVFSSWSWRIGSTLSKVVGRLMLRGRTGTVREHVNEVAKEHRAWRGERIALYGLQPSTLPSEENIESFLKQSSMFRLIIAMIRNPGKTVGLLSPDRVWNFFITCFRHPAHIRREIVKDYLTFYGIQNRSDKETQYWINRRRKEKIRLPRTESPDVSVVVPVFNHFDITMSCLAALQENSSDVSYEVILADDASIDETIEIERYCENIRVVRSEKNRGFLHNCNGAVEKANGRFIFFLNNDAFLEKGCLRGLLEVAQKDESIGIVGPKIVFPDGRLQEAGGIMWRDGSAWNYGRGDDPAHCEYNYIREVDYVSGAALLVRRDLWEKSGGFDRRFSPAYYEDADLAFQARREGYRVVYQPQAVVVHAEGLSHGTDESADIKAYQSKNRHKFVDKWRFELEARHFENGECVFLARERHRRSSTILVVDHYVPEFDKDAGSKSTLQYLKLLVEQGARVTFLPDDFYKREPYISGLEQLGIEVLYGQRSAQNWKGWWKENSRFFDVVYMHRPHIAHRYVDTFRNAPNVKLIFFGHDLHYLRLQRQYEIEQKSAIRKEAERWRKWEFRVIDASDVVYYPSDVEVEAVRKHFPGKTVRAIPLYITESVNKSVPAFGSRTGIFFVGGFRHPPNVDGVIWFVNEVLPRIVKVIPDARLVIAGSRMPDEVLSLASEQVLVKGPVSEEELARLYAHARVVVVPLRFGAGVKGKILEAMRYRVPVVTTPVGAEGLPAPVDYLGIGEDAGSFARAVIELYTNQAKWMTASAQGAEVVDRCFSASCALRVVAEDFGLSVDRDGTSGVAN